MPLLLYRMLSVAHQSHCPCWNVCVATDRIQHYKQLTNPGALILYSTVGRAQHLHLDCNQKPVTSFIAMQALRQSHLYDYKCTHTHISQLSHLPH